MAKVTKPKAGKLSISVKSGNGPRNWAQKEPGRPKITKKSSRGNANPTYSRGTRKGAKDSTTVKTNPG